MNDMLCFVFLASELQSWLLYYALPCLVGYLPDKYLQHFARFSEAIYILLGSEITPSQLKQARDLLDRFYKDFQALYGMKCHSLVKIMHFSSIFHIIIGFMYVSN